MVKSMVVGSTTTKFKDNRVRTGKCMFLQRGRDKVIQIIEKSIANYTFIPVGVCFFMVFSTLLCSSLMSYVP
jgi:prolyl 4-hydroxylase